MDLGLDLPSSRLGLAVLGIMLAGDVLGLWLTGLRLDPASVSLWLKAAGAVVGLLILCRLVEWRLSGDEARGAVLVRGLTRRISLFSTASLYLGAITTAGAILSYVVATAGLPFQDTTLAAADRSLGFDWVGVARRVCGTPWLEVTLAFAYRSSMAQVALLVPVLAFTGQRRRLSEFVALFALTGLVIALASGLLPAEAAFFHYQPSVICPHAAADGTLAYRVDLLALRQGTMGPLAFRAMTGIVTFPSFHTALAICVIYGVARTPVLAWPMIALNLLVIAATMPLGGHYLTDVLVGGLIAAVAIGLVRALNRDAVADRVPAFAALMRPASPWRSA
jgi:membrane-associated phospholipid phosphatase